MSKHSNPSSLIVPQANAAMDQLKHQVAQEVGVQLPPDGYYGYVSTRDTGAIGGHMVRRMVQIAEETLARGGGRYQG